ncbi:MAG: dienelactone hydrolase family protein [Rickettsiaceae bacterium]|nr:dienelactone hydrolase family protein [Rickettsiaceae bacterium]
MIEQKILEYPEVKPKNDKTTGLVVFLHGVGSDGDDLISLVPFLQHTIPGYHFISPHGIEPYDLAPYGRQWFSLIDRSPDIIMKLTERNSKLVEKIIKNKQEELSLTNKDTIIFGFSQGTMMGVYLTLTATEPYAATIAFSGRLLPPKNITNKKTPICIIHGQEDDMVDAMESNHMESYLIQYKIPCQKLIIPNLTHSIDDKGLQFALDFIRNLQK